MKEVYVKPNLNIEMFTLTQSIATSCGWKNGSTYGHPTYKGKSSCGWDDGYGEVYWVSTPACGGAYPEDLDVAEVCYNAPNGHPQIFSS